MGGSANYRVAVSANSQALVQGTPMDVEELKFYDVQQHVLGADAWPSS